MAGDDLDLVLCLGDYIYEYGAGSDYVAEGGEVRSHGTAETTTLEDYRNRHALYKSDRDLQAAHAAAPWIVTWDDHEVENDYAGAISENGDPVERFLARRAAAYQAYYEHMPVRPDSMPAGPDMRLYRRLTFGDLVEFNVLDTRQYRADQVCGSVAPRCDALLDPAVTLTGLEQEEWLMAGTAASAARWNVLAQQVMMAQLEVDPNPASQLFNQDQWDGYPLARRRILDHLVAADVSNPIVLTGDIHSAWVGDLKQDFDDPDAPVVATEFVTTSVTSHNPFAAQLRFAPLLNPHLRFYDARHGYTRVEVTPAAWRTDFLAVDDVADPGAGIEMIATWTVEDGVPGANQQ
jgi:alkaline phosphatase D